MKRKPKLTTICIALLFFIGLGIMLYPTASDWYVRKQLQRQLSQYTAIAETDQEDYSQMWAAAEDYNRRLAQRENQFAVSDEEMTEISTLLNPLGTGMMGHIDIEKISVHLPVYQGIEESALQAGAGWWIGTSIPAGGESTHCVITAHTGLVRAKMFTDLDQMEEGDRFTITVLDRVLTYEVDQILITEPDEINPLLIEAGKDLCTLYTCYPYGMNTHRLLVRGHRVPEEETEISLTSSEMAVEGKMVSWLAVTTSAAVVLAAAFFYLNSGNFGNGPQKVVTEKQTKRKEMDHETRKKIIRYGVRPLCDHGAAAAGNNLCGLRGNAVVKLWVSGSGVSALSGGR